MSKTWRLACLTVPEDNSLYVQQILLSLGALGLEVEDDESRNVPEKDFSPNHQAMITATFEHESDIDSRIVNALPEYEIHLQDLADGDWANEFIKSWRAFSLGDGIWIKPSWDQEFQPPEGSLVLEIDPGMAFGTGHHETTTLCARATREAVRSGCKRVLDIGTGTGILAMIAAKSGANYIVGTDNDPVACDVARENIEHNKLNVKISDKDPDQLGERFDLVVANILANPLIELAPQIIQAIAPQGLLLLSGILETQASKVQAAYEAIGLKHAGTEQLGEWVLIRFTKT